MKSKYLLSFFALLLFPAMVLPQVHFPLHVGDHWGYSSAGLCENLVINSIDKDTVIDGKTYFHFTGGKTLYGALFVRTSSGKVYSYDTAMHAEYPIFDFLAKAGDTISVVNNERYIALGNMRFFRSIPLGTGEGYTYTLRDSIGVTEVSSTVNPCTWKLTGASIQGKQVVLSAVSIALPDRSGALELFEPYPNPFNPETKISFQLSAVSQTTLTILDVIGREVALLVNEVKGPGTYAVQWDASHVSSGIYFAKLQTVPAGRQGSGGTLIKKMMLLK
jgi:hypothetical protein